jgi:cysteine desulfurase
MQQHIYLDWNATTPPHADVLAAMTTAAPTAWANPSSVHRHGSLARRELERARAAVADLMGCDARDVTFTSGGTEANNMALRAATGAGTRVLYTSVAEHASVVAVARAIAREQVAHVHWTRVAPDGQLDLADLASALRQHGPGLISLQAVNQETGVVQPVAEALALAREFGCRVHSDTVQSVGRSADLWLEADYRSIAFHKLRGPKGVGALVVRSGAPLRAFLLGGAQEQGLRAGTVDGVAAAGVYAAVTRAAGGPARYAALAPLRDRLESGLLQIAGKHAQRVGTAARAPHVSCIAFTNVRAPELVAALDLAGVSCSAGSACSAGTVDVSPVITAMLGAAVAAGTIRFSLGEETSAACIETALTICGAVLPRFLGR